jgi:D-methionine transport system ATP-binding protein
MSVVREISDFVYVMDHGKVVEQNNVEQLLLHPQHPITRSLLAGLFIKELPHHLHQSLVSSPCEGEVVVRLVFSGDSAQSPVIADCIREYNIPVNILAGSMDHLRATAFGTLLISAPYQKQSHEIMMAHFSKHGISAEVMGYLPVEVLND